MQFVNQKNSSKVKIMRYAGYDKEKRRSIVKQVASLDKYDPEITDEMREIFTPDELTEVENWIKDRRVSLDNNSKKVSFDLLDRYLDNAGAAIAFDLVEVTEGQALKIYRAISDFEKLLKAKGFKKTEMLKKAAEKKTNSNTEDKQAVLTL